MPRRLQTGHQTAVMWMVVVLQLLVPNRLRQVTMTRITAHRVHITLMPL